MDVQQACMKSATKCYSFFSLGSGWVLSCDIAGTWVLTGCVQFLCSMRCYFWITVHFPRVVKCVAFSVSVALIVHNFCNFPRRTFFALHNSNLPEAPAKAERIVRMKEGVCMYIKGEAAAHRSLPDRPNHNRPAASDFARLYPSATSPHWAFILARKNLERVFKKLLHFFTFLKFRKSEIV